MLRLIAGSGRSGTTWVLDTLAEANRLRPVFEPLHPDTSTIGQQYAYAYIDRSSECLELEEFFTAVARNQMRSIWTCYRIKPERLRITGRHLCSLTELKKPLRKWQELARSYRAYRDRERRSDVLVKCIRANLMLDWIKARFEARIVLLMRHPCAVVESQLRLSEHWDPFELVEKYADNKALRTGPLSAPSKVLESRLSRPQALAAIWCIENLVPAAQAATNGYEIVFYEELLERPEIEWPRVARGLSLSSVPGAVQLAEPSQQAAVAWQRGGTEDANYSRDYGSWRARLTGEDLQHVDSMLDAFGIDFYDVQQIRPRLEAFARRFS